MNILTFDIEEWYLESYKLNCRGEYDRYLNGILDKLDERNTKATFFCVGEMGRLFPEVVNKIDSRGHEVGCHSNIHTWLNKMTVDECRKDTQLAIENLEQCIGKKIKSYRAPAFSIGENNKWAFEILAENGIERDASIYPTARDFGGFPNFGVQKPTLISYNGIILKEFPVPLITIAGKQFAYSGGGYFRFFPLWFVKKYMQKESSVGCRVSRVKIQPISSTLSTPHSPFRYSMCYFHIGDLLPESNGVMTRQAYEEYFKEPGTLMNRYKRYVKSNLGKKGAFDKMKRLIMTTDFVNLNQATEIFDWLKAPIVEI